MDLSKNTEIEELLTKAKSLAESFETKSIFNLHLDKTYYKNSKLQIIWVQENQSGSDCTNIKQTNQYEFKNKLKVWRALNNESIAADKTDYNILKEMPVICISNIEKQNFLENKHLSEFNKRSKYLIVQLLEALEPDVVIFCDTYPFLESILGLNQLNSFGSCRATANAGIIYIDLEHSKTGIKKRTYSKDISKAFLAFKKQIDALTKQTDITGNLKNEQLLLHENFEALLSQISRIKAIYIKGLEFEKATELKNLELKIKQAKTDAEEITSGNNSL